jgi:hypothetical protein
MHDLLLGTIQESVLGPIPYSIFVSPLFDLEFFLAIEDDNFITKFSSNTKCIIRDMEKVLESITRWLRDSGYSVKKAKIKICKFYKLESRPVIISLSDTKDVSKM